MIAAMVVYMLSYPCTGAAMCSGSPSPSNQIFFSLEQCFAAVALFPPPIGAEPGCVGSDYVWHGVPKP